MFDPNSSDDVIRLRKACSNSLREMKPFRENYVRAIKELAGPHYASNEGTKEHLNLIEFAWTIYQQNLMAVAPQTTVTSRNPQWRSDAYSFERAINALLDEQEVQVELELWVLEAMFSPMGVLKVALDAQSVSEVDGQRVVSGPPLVRSVLFDDLIIDMTAKNPKRAAFIGDRYQLTVEEALDLGYDPAEVAVQVRKYKDATQDSEDTQKISRRRTTPEEDEYQDLLEVWDIWLPMENLVVTFGGDLDSNTPMRIVEWTGPKNGPYHCLWFGIIPGNALPNPPVGLWRDLHELINCLFNKLAQQAERQKTLGAVESTNEQDGTTIRDAADGDMVRLNSLGSFAQINSGGISQQNLMFVQVARQFFGQQAGNIDIMGGTMPMSNTVGQDELLSQAASKRLAMYQMKVYEATKRLLRDYGEYMWYDPVLEVEITKEIQGTDDTINDVWSPDQMRGDLYNYEIDMQPYSTQQRSPEQKMAQIDAVWAKTMEMLPIMQGSGMMPNPEWYVKTMAKLLNLPELSSMIIYTQGETMPNPEGGGMPQKTTRRYERISGQGNKQDPMQQMMQQMGSMGADNNQGGGGSY